MKELEKAEKMKYVTTIERRAIERGLTQGIEQGIEQGSIQTLRELLIDVLQLRFQHLPDELLVTLSQLSDLSRLKQLHRQAIIAGSLEEFEQMIEAGGQD